MSDDPKPTAAQVFSRQMEEIWLGVGTDQEKRAKCLELSEKYLEESRRAVRYRFPTEAEKAEGVD